MSALRHSVRVVGLIALALGVAALIWFLPGRKTRDTAGRARPATEQPPIDLPGGMAVIRIAQRTSEVVPGSNGKVQVHIADITAGQAELTIYHKEGKVILGTTSMKEGDKTTFDVDGFGYVLSIPELKNRLVGDDYAVIEISRRDEAGGDIDPQAMIELLLAEVESSGVTFIRNGKEHQPKQAASHLRRKWKYAGSKIETAEQFIDEAATRSSTTGKPYLIKLKDGSTIEAADWLYQRLKDIRARNKQPGGSG